MLGIATYTPCSDVTIAVILIEFVEKFKAQWPSPIGCYSCQSTLLKTGICRLLGGRGVGHHPVWLVSFGQCWLLPRKHRWEGNGGFCHRRGRGRGVGGLWGRRPAISSIELLLSELLAWILRKPHLTPKRRAHWFAIGM